MQKSRKFPLEPGRSLIFLGERVLGSLTCTETCENPDFSDFLANFRLLTILPRVAKGVKLGWNR